MFFVEDHSKHIHANPTQNPHLCSPEIGLDNPRTNYYSNSASTQRRYCVVVWNTPLRVHFLNVQCTMKLFDWGGISRGASAKLRSVGLLCDVQRKCRFLSRATAKTHVVKDTGESHAAVAGGKLAPSAVGGGGFSGLSVGTMRRTHRV